MEKKNENITEELTQEVEKLMKFVKFSQAIKNKILKKNKKFEKTISKEVRQSQVKTMQSRKASIECSFDELEEQLKQGKIKKIKKTIQAIKKAVQDTMEFALRLMNKQK